MFLCLRLGNTGWTLNWTTNPSEVPYAMSFSLGTVSTYSKSNAFQLNIPEVGKSHLSYHLCPCASRELHQSKLSFLKLCFSSHTIQGTVFKHLHPHKQGQTVMFLFIPVWVENSPQISILLWRKFLENPETSSTSQRLEMRFRD